MFEILLLGDSCVGKSSLIERFCTDSFSSTYYPTINESYKCKEAQKLKLRIWDTVTQDHQSNILNQYRNESTGFILMHSMDNPKSLENLNILAETLNRDMNGKLNAVVVGNKLSGKESRVKTDDIHQFIAKYHLKYFEVNVRDDFDVDQPFLELAARHSDLAAKRQDEAETDGKVGSEFLLNEKHPHLERALTYEDLRHTNPHTRNHSYLGEKSSMLGLKEGEELEVNIRRLIREALSEGQFENDRCYGLFEKKPLDEVILEYKQELVDLTSNYNDFRSFITREIDLMNERTQEQLSKIEETYKVLLAKIEGGVKVTEPQSIPNTQLELDFYDNNVPQTTVHIGSQWVEEEIYRLKQRIEGYEKQLSEGLCYMENKLKLTCSALNNQVRRMSASERLQDRDEPRQKVMESRTTTHAAAQSRRVSLFSPVAAIYRRQEEVQTFGEAVENHNLSLHHTPVLAIRKVSSSGPRSDVEGDLERKANSLDTLDLSTEEINNTVPQKMHLSMGFLEDHHEEQEQAEQNDEVVESNDEEGSNEEQEADECDYGYNEARQVEDPNYGEVKQELASIWNTLNKVITNTQDCFQELKSEIVNTSMNRGAFSQVGSNAGSVLDHREKELTVEVHRQAPEQEKSIKDIITEVKDDVHNQIVHVQKELEGKMVMLRDNIFCQYNNFSEKMQFDQLEIKRYVDEQIDDTRQEMHEMNLGNQLIHSHLETNEGQGSNSQEKSENISQVNEEMEKMQKEKEENEKEAKLQKETLEKLKNKVNNLEENVMDNIWKTIGLVAGRIDKVEQSVKANKK